MAGAESVGGQLDVQDESHDRHRLKSEIIRMKLQCPDGDIEEMKR
jgi:hypothetical protein